MTGLPGAIFEQVKLGHTQQGCHKTAPTPLPPFTDLLYPQICHQSNIFRIIWTASWTTYEFGRTTDAFRVNVEQNISGHHRKLVCLKGRSYRIVHSRWFIHAYLVNFRTKRQCEC
ncbi:hypothetical protein TNCV_216171 [Trichonephila clavipes]|nr:hypothetical protein TNCV_216171 [Trichonephila clavipes]